MREFNESFTRIENLPEPKPCFDNILKVLSCQKPDRPTLFEFFMNPVLDELVTGMKAVTFDESNVRKVKSFAALGYDYTTIHASSFGFKRNTVERKESQSANEGSIITDRESYGQYVWDEPDDFYQNTIEKLAPHIPDGMKLIVMGPGGVLENVTSLVGYDNLCYMLADDPELVEIVFREVGSRLQKYYERIIDYPSVGAIISNDDWGFNTQTMLSPRHMREYIFPWHKKIVEAVHQRNKPCILHSCGNPIEVMDDITDDIKYDGRHSYEDNIIPVEDFYEKFHERIAVIGGIDVNFIVTKTPEQIKERSKKMLERTAVRGSYALGTGNSVPEYIPVDNYLAMLSAAYDFD